MNNIHTLEKVTHAKRAARKTLHPSKSAESGSWMTEYGLVLIAVVTTFVLALAGFAILMKDSDDAEERQNYIAIYKASRMLREPDGYANLTTERLQQAGGLPKSMAGARSGTPRNKFRGAITVSGSADSFTVVSAGIPQDRCLMVRSAVVSTGIYDSVSDCSTSGTTDLTMTGW